MTQPTTISDDQPLDPVDERLVAYLDGELDPAARDQLESELLDDESLRSRLQGLQRGWDFLEDLPSATPSEQLVETTMELVVKDLTKASTNSDSFLNRWRIPMAVVASCFVALGIGYASIHFSRQHEFEQRMADLELAQDLNAYLDGDDLNLMRYLSMHEDWQSLIRTLTEVRRDASPTASTVRLADIPVDRRLQAIEDLSRTDTTTLAAKWETFDNLAQESRQQLRETARLVDQQTDDVKLRETMRQYSLWIQRLPPKTIDAITAASAESNGEPSAELKLAVEDAIADTRAELPKESSRMISEDTEELIMTAMNTIVNQRLQRRNSTLSDVKAFFMRASEPPSKDLLLAILSSRFVDESTAGFRRRLPRVELTDSEIMFILHFLPDEDLDRIDMLAMDNEMLRLVTIKSMIAEAVSRTFRSLRLSTAEQYNLMDEEDRQRLDLQPPNIIEDRLAGDSWGTPRSQLGPPVRRDNDRDSADRNRLGQGPPRRFAPARANN